ncbi:MAG: sugar transferase [Muribaculaceae bacterium]|nr:sugar transferase [Muribaculaceae bacterium]
MEGRHFSANRERMKYVVADYVTTSLAFFVFDIFRFVARVHSGYEGNLWIYLSSSKLIWEQVFVPLCLMGVYWLSGFYNKPILKSRLNEFTVTLYSALSNAMLIYLVMMVNDSTNLRSQEYMLICVLACILFLFTYTGRYLITRHKIRQLRNRKWRYTTLIIGYSNRGVRTFKNLRNGGSVWAFDVVGFVKIPGERETNRDNSGLPVYDLEELEKVCKMKHVDQIVISPEQPRDKVTMQILNRLFPLGVSVHIEPDELSYLTSEILMDDILGVPFVSLTSPRLSEFEKNIKRVFDVVCSSVALLILLPLFGVISICVKRSSPGSVFYTQERIGLRQRPFRIYKFRSMRQDAEADGPRLSNDNDSRITSVGKVLRKYRLDELPQFWNVIKGDMSLVGPRPERAYYIREIVKKAPYYNLLFQVRPGITSWGMVKYGYASNVTQMVKRSSFDLIYLNNMSIATDMKILIYTVRTVVKGSGK